MSRLKVDIPVDAQLVYKTNIPVLVSHINYGNHLGNDSLLSILQEAMLRFIKNSGMYDETKIDKNIGFLIVSMSISYNNEAFHGDDLSVEVFVSDVTKKTCDISYKVTTIMDNEIIDVATALMCILFFDFNERKSANIPDIFKKSISFSV